MNASSPQPAAAGSGLILGREYALGLAGGVLLVALVSQGDAGKSVSSQQAELCAYLAWTEEEASVELQDRRERAGMWSDFTTGACLKIELSVREGVRNWQICLYFTSISLRAKRDTPPFVVQTQTVNTLVRSMSA